MSKPLVEDQESKKVHDPPPGYNSCQPSQDILASVVENEHARRKLNRRLIGMATELIDLTADEPDQNDYPLLAELVRDMGQLFTEGAQLTMELANVYKERPIQNTELHIAMSRLTESEFDQAYASLRRDPNQQMQHKLAQDHKGDCYDKDQEYNSQRSLGTKQAEEAGDCTRDSPCSCDQFFELSTKVDFVSARVDKINDKFDESLQSHATANISKMTDDMPAKPPRSFWKRIWKHSDWP
ncbi:uncharacterized protein N7459_004228 [Penicillium hispanicum]|uniref:uncharacterized protein n=1 Tax=Penicillium hispanicum TaxID=1080232 RepID=UPI0025424736|nr:uncharacterized protein N7459_004228 [Penicillium hispanicum]KAJ5584428.1 hypothetical protein N7459_004228 [Penicillium hispanicum]